MDLLANVPSWDDIERNLDQKYSELNQSVNEGLQSAHDGWNGFTRRVSQSATQAYGYAGGRRIDSVRLAMTLSYPIIQANLQRKWASIEIEQILPVLLQLVKEVAMILGGSVAVGTIIGGAAGSFAFGVGAVPGAAAGAGIGLQVGNLILLGLGLSAVAEYFYKGLPACLSTLQEGMTIAWHAEDGLRPVGLDPTGGSEWKVQERIDRAARQLAKGQEQLVLLLLTAIVTYLTRGQVKAGIVGSMDSIAARSAKLQAEISNKQFANWLARNEQKLLAQPELKVNEPTPLKLEEAPKDTLREQPVAREWAQAAEKQAPDIQLRRDYLNQKFGRTGDIIKDIDIRGNQETAANFFKSQGYKPADYEGYMNGLDFTKPVYVETINSGKKLWQYQVPGGRQGMWYSPTPDIVPGQLGINPLGQIYKTDIVVPKIANIYQTTDKVTLLRSTSAPVLDTWSVPSQPFDAIGGARQMTSGQKELFKLITPDTP
ncbi:polymorphic toxin type 46 domain-containing protein [Pseudomonas alliivorans]|uniref:polymorphic toxin type 46 domain-containing protein n=1 Tax=Pseudomonas alliivorans TaxID=2810613 RepID=UPI001AE62608|nr:polymorphic toxin type 46 domain-containing protein [Pseudomonas alliivorans]MBP0953939.1 hypothetical protein [Pseudomonas alliivorans]MEE4576376.1 polymorphic toxin type 46 domain-containing protein [Pseudomonas alliivorans]MEE4688321.1 polymorphic toxin type 46 domain-containing protein [Pseudomonas alliivorans]MEE4709096.1 polymorphic toxin type 46 domain-containing protein [Pseudomonas alliivorans]MEE4780725.1 polymorphic toxin type 46 domain-containing protein [Pseudomonas alliivorans